MLGVNHLAGQHSEVLLLRLESRRSIPQLAVRCPDHIAHRRPYQPRGRRVRMGVTQRAILDEDAVLRRVEHRSQTPLALTESLELPLALDEPQHAANQQHELPGVRLGVVGRLVRHRHHRHHVVVLYDGGAQVTREGRVGQRTQRLGQLLVQAIVIEKRSPRPAELVPGG